MKESEGSAPGEKPQFLGVREQRVTNVLIGVAIGLSTLITPILALIPMPVLYGVFLFMGVSALKVTNCVFWKWQKTRRQKGEMGDDRGKREGR